MPDTRGKHPNARATQFKPGHDPKRNTTGRPALGASVQECLNKFAELTPAEIRTIVKSKTAKANEVIAANRVLAAIDDGADFDRVMDRTVGKPAQRTELTGKDGQELFKAYVGVDIDRV